MFRCFTWSWNKSQTCRLRNFLEILNVWAIFWLLFSISAFDRKMKNWKLVFCFLERCHNENISTKFSFLFSVFEIYFRIWKLIFHPCENEITWNENKISLNWNLRLVHAVPDVFLLHFAIKQFWAKVKFANIFYLPKTHKGD